MKTAIELNCFTGFCLAFLLAYAYLCKIHGIFLWIGLGLYALIYKRKMFLNTGMYLSLVLTLVLISPIIFWNIIIILSLIHITASRVAVHSIAINASSFFQAITGQFLYNNPINVFLIIQSFYFLKRKLFLQLTVQRLLLLTGLPVIIIVTIISLFNPVLPHWSGPDL